MPWHIMNASSSSTVIEWDVSVYLINKPCTVQPVNGKLRVRNERLLTMNLFSNLEKFTFFWGSRLKALFHFQSFSNI